MIPNTHAFAELIKTARTTAGLTQDNLHDRGATYRQMQGRIENGDLAELEETVLDGYDTAYRWPRGYAVAAAQAAAYNAATLTPTVDVAGDDGKTLGALYTPDHRNAPAKLGYDPETGRPVYTQCAILTNISFDILHPILNSRSGTTLLDVQAVTERAVGKLKSDPHATRPPRTFYRLTASGGAVSAAPTTTGTAVAPIALDALTDLYDLDDARRLTKALLELHPHTPTTVERAAFTFLAIAVFSNDPFTTIRRLHEDGKQFTDFYEFWTEFRQRCDASEELAEPDLQACDLLRGLTRARESAKSIKIGPYSTDYRRVPHATLPTTERVETLINSDEDRVIFYDSDVAPQIPICLNNIAPGATLTIHSASTPGLAQLSNPRLNLQSIGIAPDSDDLTVVAQHRADQIDTLTNLHGQYAVFCESGRADVVWIPTS